MNPRPAPRRTLLSALVLGVLAVVSSCAGTARINEYGDDLERNFVATCTQDTRLGDGSTTVVPLQSEDYCRCVYEKMRDEYGFTVDELRDFEAEVKAADRGEAPEVPADLKNAMEDSECTAKQDGAG